MRNQTWISVGLFVLAVWAAWQVGDKVATGDTRSLLFAAMGLAVALWQSRFCGAGAAASTVFCVDELEDLVRKYMGNGMELFFGKDILLAFVYVALFIDLHRTENIFRPPFLLFLSVFFWLGVLQVFNQNSPHILYGLLGFKVYFFITCPLVFVGYALSGPTKI